MFCLEMEGIEHEVSHRVGGHSTLGPLFEFAAFKKSFTASFGHKSVWVQSVTFRLQGPKNGEGVYVQPLGPMCELIPRFYVNAE